MTFFSRKRIYGISQILGEPGIPKTSEEPEHGAWCLVCPPTLPSLAREGFPEALVDFCGRWDSWAGYEGEPSSPAQVGLTSCARSTPAGLLQTSRVRGCQLPKDCE